MSVPTVMQQCSRGCLLGEQADLRESDLEETKLGVVAADELADAGDQGALDLGASLSLAE